MHGYGGFTRGSRRSLDWVDLVAGIRAGDEDAAIQLGNIFQDGIRLFLLRGLGQHQLQSRQREVLALVIASIRGPSIVNPNRVVSHVFSVLHQYINAQTGSQLYLVPANESRVSTDEIAIQELLAKIAAVDREALRRYNGDQEISKRVCQPLEITFGRVRACGEET